VTPSGESPHGPPPSLWPVGFAIGVVCILVGLIVSWPAVAVGAGLVLIFGFLWVRDVTRGYRTVPEPSADAAVPAEPTPAIPAHEGPAAMPEPSPSEVATYPRNKFLEGATLGLGAVIGGIVTVPAVGFAVVPAFLHQGHDEIDLGPLGNFKQDEWTVTHFFLDPADGGVAKRTAFIRYNGLLEDKPSFTILSNRCAHLGCPVQPGGLVQSEKTKDEKTTGGQEVSVTPVLGLSSFTCPCHGGSYDSEGNRIAGPPVRSLDRYDYSIQNGRLFLGNAYSVGHVEGEGAQALVKKYNLAGPGQHVDGPEQWFYPLQPPH
jgi:Rieske Fe-S protein